MSREVKLAEPTPEQLFDLVLLGLYWLRQARPRILERLGNSVLATLQHAGVITKEVHEACPSNEALLQLAEANGESLLDQIEVRRQQLIMRIGASNQWLLIAMLNWKQPNRRLLFAPAGYDLVITRVGLAYIAAKIADYTHIVTQEEFMKAWDAHAKSMRGMHGTQFGSPRDQG